MVVQVEHARSVVEYIPVDLAYGDNELQDMSGGMLRGDAVGDSKCERAPAELYTLVDNELVILCEDLQR